MPTRRHRVCFGLLGILLIGHLAASEARAQQRVNASVILQTQVAQQMLLAEQMDSGAIKCGTPAVLAGLGALRTRGIEPASGTIDLDHAWISPGGGFRLHYSTTGTHAVPPDDLSGSGTPDFVEIAGEAFDSVAQGYRELGWREPIMQSGGYYEVYFVDTEASYGIFIYGYTMDAQPTRTQPPYTSASYIVLDSRFDLPALPSPPVESLLVTIAHEYHHAIQFAYHLPIPTEPNINDFIWFAEASAVYFEEIFYDDINDYYAFVPFFMGAPQTALTAPDGLHKYGAVLWPLYLDRRYGTDTILDIWTIMAESFAEPASAHQIFFDQHQSDWLEAWGEFTLWMLHTGARADPARYFSEGAAYPPVATENATLGESVSVTLPQLAARYYVGPTGGQRGGAAVQLQPIGTTAAWGVGVAGLPTAGPPTPGSFARSPGALFQGVSAELFDWDRFPHLVRWAWTGDNTHPQTGSSVNRTAEMAGRFSDRLLQQATAGQPLMLFSPYPNPFRPDGSGLTFFAFELAGPLEVTIDIRNLSGERIWSRTLPPLEGGVHFSDQFGVGWDGRDERGRLVPSGIYLLVARAPGAMQAIRFSVIR